MSNTAPNASSGMGDDLVRDGMIQGYVTDYQHGRLTRREVLKKLAALLGGATVASAFLSACAPQPTPVPTSTSVRPTTAPPTTAPPTTAPTAAPTATTAPSATTAASPTTARTATTAPPPTTAATATGAPAATKAAAGPTATVGPTSTPQVAANDPAVEARMVEYDSQGAKIQAYLAKPTGSGPFPFVLICHENLGLVEHFKDLTRRFAKVGYASLTPDLLSREGGTEKVGQQAAPGALSAIPPERNVNDFRAAMVYMQSQPFVNKARVGMVGFCFGGAVAWRVATRIPEMKAVLPFYGANPPLEDVPNIKAAILAIYGGADTRINAGIPDIEAALQRQPQITFQKIVYEGQGHAFFNDHRPSFNANAAKDAWEKMLAWFQKYLV